MNNKFIMTFLRGLFLLIPIVGLVYLFYNLYTQVAKVVQQIIDKTPLETTKQVFLVALVTVLVLVLLVYLLGLISRTGPFVKLSKWLDKKLMESSGVYRKLKLDADNETRFLLDEYDPIYVQFNGGHQRPAFLIEENQEAGLATVFIPKDFDNLDGNIFIVPISNIIKSNMDKQDFIIALGHLGRGLDSHLKTAGEV